MAFQVQTVWGFRASMRATGTVIWPWGEVTRAQVATDRETARSRGFEVDAQFNNDRSMESQGGDVSYDLRVTMDGREVARESVAQVQYQNFQRSFSSNETDGGQGTGSPERGWLKALGALDLALWMESDRMGYLLPALTQEMPCSGLRPPKTIADGAQTQAAGQLTFPVVQRLVKRIVTVSDSQLVATMRFFGERMKMVVEPTGCLAAAACYGVALAWTRRFVTGRSGVSSGALACHTVSGPGAATCSLVLMRSAPRAAAGSCRCSR